MNRLDLDPNGASEPLARDSGREGGRFELQSGGRRARQKRKKCGAGQSAPRSGEHGGVTPGRSAWQHWGEARLG
jgi:hypothetical protein